MLVKTAFLKGKLIERTDYLRPLKEAKTNKIWQLRKCVYGLADASRYCYLKLREELVKWGSTPTQLDLGIFIWHNNNKPIGVLKSFANDVLWGGKTKFENTEQTKTNLPHMLWTQTNFWLHWNQAKTKPRLFHHNRSAWVHWKCFSIIISKVDYKN